MPKIFMVPGDATDAELEKLAEDLIASWEDGDKVGTKGGPGYGNFGHAGRPGQVGGSAGGGGYTSVGEISIPEGRMWQPHVEGMTHNTYNQFVVGKNADGTPRFEPEREKMHERIRKYFTEDVEPVPEGEQKKAIFMMGGTASGKSTMRSNLLSKEEEGKFVKVD